MNLPEYKDFTQKDKFFKTIKIDTVPDFELQIQLLRGNGSLIYRGVSEAKYKIYTSGQRHWLTRGLQNHVTYVNFVDKLLGNIRSNKVLNTFYKSLNIYPNDILYLTYLQHYGAPTPMLDFTHDLNIGLYFATDGLKQNNTMDIIGDYFSLYYIDTREFGQELVDIVNMLKTGLENAKRMLDSFKKDNPRIRVNDRLLQDIDMFTRWKKNGVDDGLFKIDYCLLENPQISNKLVMKKTGQQLIWSNLNIIAQKGCLLMYSNDTLPLEVMISQNHYLPKITCLNIHKSLADYVKKKINLSKEKIYPQEEEIARRSFTQYLDTLI